MSAGFRAVQWNRQKIVYDAILAACVVAFIGSYVAIKYATSPPKSLPDAIDVYIRAFGLCAFLMLTVILAIGPLARIDRRFMPLLYNRRHFGVLTFCVAAVHGWLMVEYFLVQDSLPDLINELTAWSDYAKFIGFPFKAIGIAALVVLFLLAATSHDYWLALLTPRVWKGLHMALYVAYGLVVMHIALGIMQYEYDWFTPLLLIVCFSTVTVLHLIAGWRERVMDRGIRDADGWLAVGAPQAIPDKGARIVAAPNGERIAVFRDGDEIGALTNLCAHQGGPLGEGHIVDGCITCPWHGYQYKLTDGCAPPPFTEKLVTYRVRLRDGLVEVDPSPLPPGTPAAIRVP